MKKIKSFLEFKTYLTESEIVHASNSYIGKKSCNILLIARDTRKCMVAMTKDSDKWSGIQSFLDSASSTIVELRNESTRCVRDITAYQGDLEISPSYVYVTEDISHHCFVGLVEKQFMPKKNDGIKMFDWITLEDLLGLSPKDQTLITMMKNDKSFFKYLKKL